MEANASVVFVPPAQAADAVLEAIAVDMPLVVCVSERIPVLDMVRVKQALKGHQTRLLGPNCVGIITPGACKIGVMPGPVFRPGTVGIISRTGTLTYDIAAQISAAGLGQSTCLSIGADPIHGLSFSDALSLFFADPDTHAVVLIGEIGGDEEERAAEFLVSADHPKPVVAYIAGRHAPPNRRMGHAGAIIRAGKGDVDSKIAALSKAGVHIAHSPTGIASVINRVLRSPDIA